MKTAKLNEFSFAFDAPMAPLLSLLIFALAHTSLLAQRGRVESGQITSPALANNLIGDGPTRPYRVYLPPSYDTTAKRFPVIYVLHGYNRTEAELVGPVQVSLDSLISQRLIGEVIVVFLNGMNRLKGSFFQSSPVIGDYETYITQDLVNLIDNRYRTLSVRESRGITGMSMGGGGAMHLALKFPATFSVVVAASSLYDSRGQAADQLARQLAQLNPTNFSQVDQLTFPLNAWHARFSGLLPNVQRPPLYTDYPYDLVEGQLVLNQSAHERCLEADVQNGDLNRYLGQAVRLRGIKIVPGRSDGAVPVNEARQFTNALSAAGLEFDYHEHSGGHVYLPEQALPFLSTHLQGAELYIALPRLNLAYATNTIQITFPTQSGVVYRIRSSSVLGAPAETWSETTRITGNGQPATASFPLELERKFFHVHAANIEP